MKRTEEAIPKQTRAVRTPRPLRTSAHVDGRGFPPQPALACTALEMRAWVAGGRADEAKQGSQKQRTRKPARCQPPSPVRIPRHVTQISAPPRREEESKRQAVQSRPHAASQSVRSSALTWAWRTRQARSSQKRETHQVDDRTTGRQVKHRSGAVVRVRAMWISMTDRLMHSAALCCTSPREGLPESGPHSWFWGSGRLPHLPTPCLTKPRLQNASGTLPVELEFDFVAQRECFRRVKYRMMPSTSPAATEKIRRRSGPALEIFLTLKTERGPSVAFTQMRFVTAS